MNRAVLLMLSGGRDSFLAACRLLDDPEKCEKLYMVTYDNGCMCEVDRVKSVADRIIERYGADRAEYLGVFSIAGIAREFFHPYFNMTPEEQKERFQGMTPSQFHCLVCRTSMYIHSIWLCKIKGIHYIAEGGRKSQQFVIEQEGMALKRYPELVESAGLKLLLPVYDLDKDWVPDEDFNADWERDNELLMHGYRIKCDEAKCLISVPSNGSIDQSVIDGVHAYYDEVMLPRIQKRGLLKNEAILLYNPNAYSELQRNNVVFVPGCLMCPVLHVKYDSSKLAWRDEILKALVDSGMGIVQMPCPEASFGGYAEGLSRRPLGVRYYELLPGFTQHCQTLASQTVEQIVALENHGVHVKAILGIENSPTCAANRIFTFGVGTEHRSGLFMGALKELLDDKKLNIPLIGITRHKKSQKKEIKLLLSTLQEYQQ